MASEDIVKGGEGDVTLGGTAWCAENISASENETSVPINNVCDYDEDDQVTYERDVTTMRRLSGSFSLSLDRNKKVLGNAAGSLRAGKEYSGVIKIFNGHTITGTFKIGSIQLENNGVGGVWGVTVPFVSQGKYVIA
jgi:hypothetical protein